MAASGQLESKKADELKERAAELSQKSTEGKGEDQGDLGKQVDEFDKYLAELSRKGELTDFSLQRITAALQAVRSSTLSKQQRREQ